jgi:hypothetical protein
MGGEGERRGCVGGRAGPHGHARCACRDGRMRRPPPGGKGAAPGGTGGGGEPLPGEVREALYGQENEENEETLSITMVEAHRRRRPSPGPSTKSSIMDEPSVGSSNRRHQDEVVDETNAAVPSDSTEDERIESKCSTKLFPELEPPPNFGKRFREFWIESEGVVSNFGKGSMRGFQPYIYY